MCAKNYHSYWIAGGGGRPSTLCIYIYIYIYIYMYVLSSGGNIVEEI